MTVMYNAPEPEWLTAKVDQRLAFMIDQMGGQLPRIGQSAILTLLTEPAEGSSDAVREQWERTCDNCGTYCPPFAEFYTGSVARYHEGTRVEFAYGACPNCVKLPA